MTETERAELKRLAEAAKDSHSAFADERLRLADAANPVAVLDLLAENEALSHAFDRAESARAQQAERARSAEYYSGLYEARAKERNDFAARLVKAEAENERLKAEIQRMKEDARNDAIERELAEDR